MVGWGILLIVLGAGSLLLPMFDYQFTLMELVDPYQPFAGIVVAAIGAVLVFLGQTRRSASATPQPAAGTPPAADETDRRP
jgi:hypothetical protein